MRQHITAKQLQCLPNEKLLKLFKILYDDETITKCWMDKGMCGRVYAVIKPGHGYVPSVNEVVTRVTIGKMIEILENKCYSWELYKQERYGDTVVIRVIKENRKIGFRGCLCDALWEAVKEVL